MSRSMCACGGSKRVARSKLEPINQAGRGIGKRLSTQPSGWCVGKIGVRREGKHMGARDASNNCAIGILQRQLWGQRRDDMETLRL
eukprot:5088253-Karenia_brevis.AAC.1